jgi:hypothetical protein
MIVEQRCSLRGVSNISFSDSLSIDSSKEPAAKRIKSSMETNDHTVISWILSVIDCSTIDPTKGNVMITKNALRHYKCGFA